MSPQLIVKNYINFLTLHHFSLVPFWKRKKDKKERYCFRYI